MDGTVLDANRNFLDAIGYEFDEIKGRHHRLFVEAAYAESAEYRAFWETLRSGKHASGEFPRLGKSGRKIWLEATYNPVLGADGKPERVMKFATDITAKKNEATRLLTMIDGMPVAVMTVDPKDEFKINYLNQTSLTTLSTIEEHLSIKVSEMMGRSFDVFHKHPHHQRTMLADSRRLPHRAKIRVGPETLDLRVSAIHGPEGEYVGPMVTWSVITAKVQMSADVSRVVEAVRSAVERMGSSAEELARSAEDARQRAASVAAGSAQMTASIQEISGQVGSVSERAQRIAAQAETTDLTVRQLAENARKVDAVVAMIRSIADQTNLLATIEAARAGAAGRGFAVVAAEVKALAEQTAKATGEIAAIQSATGEAVEAIGTITAAVADLSGLTLAMASAVEEQAASTHEMSGNIVGVSSAADATGSHVDSVRTIAEDLATHSAGLGSSVEKFLKAS
ncbi:methyl-accepting chemotaxis sensory transducer [Methylobacterium sp. AMS5]|nr:methyl-accepting chemotaxis sensory transducer [Methylobacterium sp. AMS5]